MNKILELPNDVVNRQVYYVSDPQDDIYTWANGFSLAITGRPARKIPRPVLRVLGQVGDLISMLTRKPFLITSSRVGSMTSDYRVPLEKTASELGYGPVSLEEGIRKTVGWMESMNTKNFNNSTHPK